MFTGARPRRLNRHREVEDCSFNERHRKAAADEASSRPTGDALICDLFHYTVGKDWLLSAIDSISSGNLLSPGRTCVEERSDIK